MHVRCVAVRRVVLNPRTQDASTVPTDAAADFDAGPLSWVHAEIGQSLARGLESLATSAAPADDSARSSTRVPTSIRPPARSRWSGWMRSSCTPTRSSGSLRGSRSCGPRRRRRPRGRSRVPEARDLPRRARRTAPAGSAEALSRIRSDAARARRQGRRADRSLLPGPRFARAAPSAGDGRGGQARVAARQAAPTLRARPARVPARRRRRRAQDARRGRRDRGRELAADARTFWWTVEAFFEAIVERGLDPGFGPKQLAARIDLQIRRVVEGTRRSPTGCAARCSTTSRSARRCAAGAGGAEAFRPRRADPVGRGAQPTSCACTRSCAMRASSSAARRTCGSRSRPGVPKACRISSARSTSVHAKAVEIGNAALAKLTGALVARLEKMPPSGNVSEPRRDGVRDGDAARRERGREVRDDSSSEFPRQVEAMIARLDAARSRPRDPAATAPILDEMFRRAHERVLLTQVGREIQVNLRRMEQVLDAFFRDHAKRAELATLSKDSQQIRGALEMLGQERPPAARGRARSRSTATRTRGAGRRRGSRAPRRIAVRPRVLCRGDGAAAAGPATADRAAAREAPGRSARAGRRRAESVEHAVEEMRNALPALVAEVHRAPADAAAREVLRPAQRPAQRREADRRQRARRAGGRRAARARRRRHRGARGRRRRDRRERRRRPAPELSEETQRLLATDSTALDAELLDIYLTEAADVLDAIATASRRSTRTRRSRSAAHGAPPIPHAEGQRPDGRVDRARRHAYKVEASTTACSRKSTR